MISANNKIKKSKFRKCSLVADKRLRSGLKAQQSHSPWHRTGYDEAMKYAMKWQKHYRAIVYRDAFALSGRNSGG